MLKVFFSGLQSSIRYKWVETHSIIAKLCYRKDSVGVVDTSRAWVVVRDELIGFLNSPLSVVVGYTHTHTWLWRFIASDFFSFLVDKVSSDISKCGLGFWRLDQSLCTSKDISVANPPIIHPASQILIPNTLWVQNHGMCNRDSVCPIPSHPPTNTNSHTISSKDIMYVCIRFCHILHIAHQSWLILLGSIPT